MTVFEKVIFMEIATEVRLKEKSSKACLRGQEVEFDQHDPHHMAVFNLQPVIVFGNPNMKSAKVFPCNLRINKHGI